MWIIFGIMVLVILYACREVILDWVEYKFYGPSLVDELFSDLVCRAEEQLLGGRQQPKQRASEKVEMRAVERTPKTYPIEVVIEDAVYEIIE